MVPFIIKDEAVEQIRTIYDRMEKKKPNASVRLIITILSIAYGPEWAFTLDEYSSEIIDKYGVVSSECAYEMAKHGAQVLNTDVTISFTGNAGPDVCQDGTAVGEVYMSIVYKGQAWPIPLKLEMTREELRKYCVETAISAISSII